MDMLGQTVSGDSCWGTASPHPRGSCRKEHIPNLHILSLMEETICLSPLSIKEWKFSSQNSQCSQTTQQKVSLVLGQKNYLCSNDHNLRFTTPSGYISKEEVNFCNYIISVCLSAYIFETCVTFSWSKRISKVTFTHWNWSHLEAMTFHSNFLLPLTIE